MSKGGFVYIITNKNRSTLYIGVTNDLCRRIYEHKNHLVKNSFSDRYNLEYCVYFEEYPQFNNAIQREKVLKKWNRQKKIDLINRVNPEWKILANEHGIFRNQTNFSQQVETLIHEMQKNGKLPPLKRNDDGSFNSQE